MDSRVKERMPMTSKRIVGLGVMLLLFMSVGCQAAVPREVLQKLPPIQARELEVYSTNHSVVFDLRLHSLDTCPFLSYLPNETFMDHNSKEYAVWLHNFYAKKHEEEENLWGCKCKQELIEKAKTGASARP
jgi:hypothetical protein